jgi:hypothetical protein
VFAVRHLLKRRVVKRPLQSMCGTTLTPRSNGSLLLDTSTLYSTPLLNNIFLHHPDTFILPPARDERGVITFSFPSRQL